MFSFDAKLSTAIASPPQQPQPTKAQAPSVADPLSAELLDKMQRYWYAANYLCVGQIYLLDNPLLRFLATISYNLYLYHQMVARELLWHRVPPYSGDPHYDTEWQVRYTGLAFVSAIALATAVTYLFERPLLRIRSAKP